MSGWIASPAFLFVCAASSLFAAAFLLLPLISDAVLGDNGATLTLPSLSSSSSSSSTSTPPSPPTNPSLPSTPPSPPEYPSPSPPVPLHPGCSYVDGATSFVALPFPSLFCDSQTYSPMTEAECQQHSADEGIVYTVVEDASRSGCRRVGHYTIVGVTFNRAAPNTVATPYSLAVCKVPFSCLPSPPPPSPPFPPPSPPPPSPPPVATTTRMFQRGFFFRSPPPPPHLPPTPPKPPPPPPPPPLPPQTPITTASVKTINSGATCASQGFVAPTQTQCQFIATHVLARAFASYDGTLHSESGCLTWFENGEIEFMTNLQSLPCPVGVHTCYCLHY